MSSVVTAPAGASQPSGKAVDARLVSPSMSADAVLGLVLAVALALVAFVASGGNDLGTNTWVQVALVIAGAGAAIAVVLTGAPGRAWGAITLLLFAALTALTYASIGWSVQPANSWLEANRTLSYLAAFATALALGRIAPNRWRALVGAIATVASVTCGYALLVKVFPGTFDPNEPLGRLLAPFGYWNATGLMAAIGIPACLWAGARREPPRVLRAISVPAIAVLVATLLLSYSRGALLVAVIGTGTWMALVPLRLRASLILGLGVGGGLAIAGWALATHAISADYVALAMRSTAGHAFGLVIVVVLSLATLAGFGAVFALDRIVLPAEVRRKIGTALLCAAALIPVGGVVAMVASSRGLTGEVSHVWSSLTNPNGIVSDRPGRLIALSNSRPHYWSEALTIGGQHPLAGVGALGFATAQGRYTSGIWNTQHAHVVHAHGYLLETFADFGVLGLVINLGLLFAWATAARRTLGPDWLRRGPPGAHPPRSERSTEQIGMMTLFAVVLTFGVHSLIDWTWFIPGTAIAALVCAGWLAGRGPLDQQVGRLPQRREFPGRQGATMVVAYVIAIALTAGWVVLQPLRSSDSYSSAVMAALQGHSAVALTQARGAAVENPVSVDPPFLLSRIYTSLGDHAAARRELLDAVSRQPANPLTWQQLGCYDFAGHQSSAALSELHHVVVLDPGQTQAQSDPAGYCKALAG